MDKKEAQRIRDKNRYNDRVERGLCVKCERPSKPYKYCLDCRLRKKEQREQKNK